MDASLDSVENIPFQTLDQVKPAQQSEKDRQRKFSRALKEKMEEELRKERRGHDRDEFIQDQDQQRPSEDQEPPSDLSRQHQRTGAEAEVDVENADSSTSPRIDVKA